MDIINSIKIITIPRYVLISLWLGVISLIVFAVFLLLDVKHLEGFGPFRLGGPNSAQEAAGQIFGVLIPIVLLAVLLSFSKGGVDSIRVKTKEMLCIHLPKEFSHIPDGAFPNSRRWIEHREDDPLNTSHQESIRSKAKVYFDYEKDAYYCNYVIKFQPYKTKLNQDIFEFAISNIKNPKIQSDKKLDYFSALPVRVEANIKKVNVGIFFRRDLLIKIVSQNINNNCVFNKETLKSNPQLKDILEETKDTEETLEALDANLLGKLVAQLFGHSTQATELKKESQSSVEVSEEIRYRVNPTATSALLCLPNISEDVSCVEGFTNHDEFVCVVFSAIMKPDFLWDSSEILYFSQDLMFMLRAFVNEQPDLFISKDLEAALGEAGKDTLLPFKYMSSPSYL